MTASELKKSILQMAVEGKLTEQNKNDEPAEKLLKRIKEEKEKLIKEGKIKKEKTVSEIYKKDGSYYERVSEGKNILKDVCIDEELPFDIPDSWVWVRLNNIVSILGDGIHGTPKYDINGSFAFINGNNLSNGKIVIKPDTKYLTKEEANKHYRNLNINTVLVSINGTIGNVAFYNNENIILGKSSCYFNLIYINKRYIKILLETDYFLKYALTVSTGTTIKNVPLYGMRNFIVPLPPIEEQRRIVEKINILMPLINEYDELEKSITKLNKEFPHNIKKSVLQYAIEGKLTEQNKNDEPAEKLLKRIKEEKEKLIKEGRIKKEKTTSEIYKKDGSYYERVLDGKNIVKDVCIDDELPFDIPDSWVWVRLGNICKLIDGEKRINEKHIIMDAKFLRGKVDGTFANSGKYVSAGTYLILVDGENSGEVFITREEGYMGSTFKILNISLCLNKHYILYFLELYKLILKKSKKGVAIPHLNKELFFNLLLPLPPIEEQNRIVRKIKKFNEIINTIK